jgi:hypothetical protein
MIVNEISLVIQNIISFFTGLIMRERRNFQDNIFINFQRLLEIKYKLKIHQIEKDKTDKLLICR